MGRRPWHTPASDSALSHYPGRRRWRSEPGSGAGVGDRSKTVALWRVRFGREGSDCLWEVAEGRGRKPLYDADKVAAIIEQTLQDRPAGATHWSCRTMAKAQGVSKATVNRIWQSHRLQPHRTKSFKLSRDPRFLEKLTDVVGLYLNPPEKALVLCVDEKSQIQALDRTQPGLPLKKGRCGTMTHDYKRNGTTTLFAALEIAQGKVVGQCYARHRHQEFIKFLKRLDEEFPRDLNLHVVMDNYGTHSHPRVQSWLKRHPRFVPHFIPTSSSWLNLVERWFGELTGKRIRRGVFVSVQDLHQAIHEYMAVWNQTRSPSFGPRQSNPSSRSSAAAVRPWSKSSPAAPSPSSDKNKENNSSRL